LSADTQDQPDLRFTARLISAVYAGDPLNALGGLTFWYQLENVLDPATEGRSLQGLGIPFDVPTSGIEVNGEGGNGPDLVGLSSSGNSVLFVWITDPVEVGTSSAWLVIYTGFASYREQLVGVANGTVEDVAGLVPTGTDGNGSNGAVPDAGSSLLLLSMSALALAGLARLRSQR
jgi:hypothetical protein